MPLRMKARGGGARTTLIGTKVEPRFLSHSRPDPKGFHS